MSTIEHDTIAISNLRDEKALPILSSTVLKDNTGKKRTGELNALAYFFEFLNAYDFSSEGSEEIQEENKQLINASVLGLIFEKINGYKDGSFFTPGFITMYMCRETIRRAVLQKFKEAKGWECETIDQLYDKIEDRKEANALINSLKICDPAVGSGHFLVSALNEIIAIKSELEILLDKEGKRLKNYEVEVINDELIVTDEDGKLFEYLHTSKESQRVQETLFHEKQTIIENCLFGVDINPNSVKICRLRLWIELLKNAYYTDGITGMELETLPNIDINIKCGNSLISRFALDADLKQALKNSKGKLNIESYKLAVSSYRDAKSKDDKRNMETLINEIKGNFRSEISKNDPKISKLYKSKGELVALTTQTGLFGMSDKEKKKFEKDVEAKTNEIDKLETEIEEIKNNKIYENAFEWRFEFPEVLNDTGDFIGFDAVIGNPPYIRQEDLGIVKQFLSHYEVYLSTADILVYFFELGLKILKEHGFVCFITSNKFMKANYGKQLRNYLWKYNLIRIVDFGELNVFEEAATFPAIFLISNESNESAVSFSQIRTLKFESLETIVNDTSEQLSENAFSGENWSLTGNDVYNIMSKMRKDNILLGEYINGHINYGIKTGYNEAFVINESERSALIEADHKSGEVIYPYAIGDDIRKYHVREKNRYIILSKIGIDIENYPAVFNHLKKFQPQLEKRWDKGNHWWELRACAYYDVFDTPKIVFPDIAKESRWTFVEDPLIIGNTAYVIPIKDFYLLGVMNSKAVYFYYSQIAAVLGDISKGGRLRWIYQDVIKIPVPKVSAEIKQKIENLVNQTLTIKKEDSASSTLELEKEIDKVVYDLYNLTTEDIKIIEGNFS